MHWTTIKTTALVLFLLFLSSTYSLSQTGEKLETGLNEFRISKGSLMYVVKKNINKDQRYGCNFVWERPYIVPIGTFFIKQKSEYDETCSNKSFVRVITEDGLLGYLEKDSRNYWTQSEINELRIEEDFWDSIGNLFTTTYPYIAVIQYGGNFQTEVGQPCEQVNIPGPALLRVIAYDDMNLVEGGKLKAIAPVKHGCYESPSETVVEIPEGAADILDLNDEIDLSPFRVSTFLSEKIDSFFLRRRIELSQLGQDQGCGFETTVKEVSQTAIETAISAEIKAIGLGGSAGFKFSQTFSQTVTFPKNTGIVIKWHYVPETGKTERIATEWGCAEDGDNLAGTPLTTVKYWHADLTARPPHISQQEYRDFEFQNNRIVIKCNRHYRVLEKTMRSTHGLDSDQTEFFLSRTAVIPDGITPDSFAKECS